MAKIDTKITSENPIDFKPINDDHAVKNVVFSLSFDQNIAADDIRKFVEKQPNIRIELPSVKTINSDTEFGFSFSYLRPDGTAIWVVRFAGQEIGVECTRYTRWEKISQQALSYIKAACEVILEKNENAVFLMAQLRFIDAFVNSDEEVNLSSLLKPNSLVAAQIFDSGASWHSETGWFQEIESDLKVLNRVNVTSILEEGYDLENKPSVRTLVKMDHFQETRTKNWVGRSILENINGLFDMLHKDNKKIITQLLAENMQQQIGLWSKK